MSKRALKIYLKELKKSQLEEQILELYQKFKEVKAYYNFAFNPKEELLMEEAKFKISKEYFPLNGRRPKTRRSVAQKIIKQFKLLGVEPSLIIDIMLYNVEIAQIYCRDKMVKQDSFYKSMYNSFEEAVAFITSHGQEEEYKNRLNSILEETEKQKWINALAFESLLLKTLS